MVIDGELYFSARRPQNGRELWATNGNAATMVKDLLPGIDSGSPRELTRFRGTVYFTANDGLRGRELWKLVEPDTSVKVTMPGKVSFNRAGRGTIRIGCPAGEASGPCKGKLTLSTRGKVRSGGKKRIVLLAKAKFSAGAGKSAKVKLRLSAAGRKLLRKVPAARKLKLKVTVSDSAGNKANLSRNLKAKGPR